LSRLWRITLPEALERSVAARLGADVPFFLDGGTALGLERGDLLFPLVDFAPTWVTLVIPPFGVSTQEAFGWFDADGVPERPASPIDGPNRRREEADLFMSSTGGRRTRLPPGEQRNDLEASVSPRHPDISRIVRALRRQGAHYSAMSGSGSSVFGLFASKEVAVQAAAALSTRGRRAVVTATVGRTRYAALSTPRGLAQDTRA
jgi:4-diphosphocytidyl-2-C-methyl-D-erythritol kinase